MNKKFDLYQCEICQLTKHTRHVYSSLKYKQTHPFSMIHNEYLGLSKIKNTNGVRWFITFIDEGKKFETASIFETFHKIYLPNFRAKFRS